MPNKTQLPAEISEIEIDGNMPIVRLFRALASEGLTLTNNSATNRMRVIEATQVGVPRFNSLRSIFGELHPHVQSTNGNATTTHAP